VVTSVDGDRSCGLTATSFISVSLRPPLVLVSIDRGADTAGGILRCEAFGISILGEGQSEVARTFAVPGLRTKFRDVQVRPGRTGVPVLEGAHAALECSLWRTVPAGDHVLFLGRVVAVWLEEGSGPLVYHEGRYNRVVPIREAEREVRVALAPPRLVDLLNEGGPGWGQWGP
jgi:flavin reductase (DIM6/NTAB) family NADH-FMN oxidoreductase RutF